MYTYISIYTIVKLGSTTLYVIEFMDPVPGKS